MELKIKSALKETGWIAAKTAAVSAIILGGVYVTVPAIGFSPTSIVAGSVASYYQRDYLRGRILRGSTFSMMQRVGVKGLWMATKMGVHAASATATGIYTVCNKLLEKRKNKKASTGVSTVSDELCESSDDEEVEDVKENSTKKVYKRKKHTIDTEWEELEVPASLETLIGHGAQLT